MTRRISDGRKFVRAQRGLTIAELLTVAAAITALVAALVPAISRAQGAAMRARCAVHLRSQAQGAQALAANYSGELLTGCVNSGATDNYYYTRAADKKYAHYFLASLGYVSNPERNFYCPAQTNPKFMLQSTYNLANPAGVIRVGYSTYATGSFSNTQVWQSSSAYAGTTWPWNVGNTATPNSLKKLLAFDSRAIYSDGIQLYNDVDLAHQTGANAAYGDGSVKYVRRVDFEGPLSQLVHPGAAGLDNAAAASLWLALDAAH